MALIKCPECGKEISDLAKACPSCGCPVHSGSVDETESVRIVQMPPMKPKKNPGVAVVLSLLLPGLGQLYNGQIGIGLVMMVIIVGMYILGSLGIFIGAGLHVWLIYDAYKHAYMLNSGTAR